MRFHVYGRQATRQGDCGEVHTFRDDERAAVLRRHGPTGRYLADRWAAARCFRCKWVEWLAELDPDELQLILRAGLPITGVYEARRKSARSGTVFSTV